MRRLSVLAGITLLVLVAVPLTSAAPAPAARYVSGNIVAAWSGGDGSAGFVFRFEVRTSPSGTLQFGYYDAEGMNWAAGTRTKSTVDNVLFYKDASGALAAQFGGKECVISDPNRPAGDCFPYALVVTDGAAVGQADTFCGGLEPLCQFKFDVLEGDISIYGIP